MIDPRFRTAVNEGGGTHYYDYYGNPIYDNIGDNYDRTPPPVGSMDMNPNRPNLNDIGGYRGRGIDFRSHSPSAPPAAAAAAPSAAPANDTKNEPAKKTESQTAVRDPYGNPLNVMDMMAAMQRPQTSRDTALRATRVANERINSFPKDPVRTAAINDRRRENNVVSNRGRTSEQKKRDEIYRGQARQNNVDKKAARGRRKLERADTRRSEEETQAAFMADLMNRLENPQPSSEMVDANMAIDAGKRNTEESFQYQKDNMPELSEDLDQNPLASLPSPPSNSDTFEGPPPQGSSTGMPHLLERPQFTPEQTDQMNTDLRNSRQMVQYEEDVRRGRQVAQMEQDIARGQQGAQRDIDIANGMRMNQMEQDIGRSQNMLPASPSLTNMYPEEVPPSSSLGPVPYYPESLPPYGSGPDTARMQQYPDFDDRDASGAGQYQRTHSQEGNPMYGFPIMPSLYGGGTPPPPVPPNHPAAFNPLGWTQGYYPGQDPSAPQWTPPHRNPYIRQGADAGAWQRGHPGPDPAYAYPEGYYPPLR